MFISACGDDDDNGGTTTDPLVGVYTLSNVTLQEEVTYLGTTYPAGTDLTVLVQTALYAESPCDNGPNTVIDMRENFEVFYACKNETTTPVNFGGWSVTSDRSILTLNLVIAGNNFPLVISNLMENTDNIQGTIENYPLVDSTVTPPEIQTVEVTIEFQRTEL